MADDDDSLALGNESSGQGSDEDDSSGDSGDGADARGQESNGAGENPAKKTNPPPDNSDNDDDDSDLIQALASGKLEDIDDDGSIKNPKAKKDTEESDEEDPPASEPEAEEADDEPKDEADESEEEESDDEEDKEKPHKLSDEEKAEIAKAPKSYHKELTKYFTERATLKTEAAKAKAQYEELVPVKKFTDGIMKHAGEAGLVSNTDGKIDAASLFDVIEEQRLLHGKSNKEVAKYYRDLAEDLDPEGVPVTIPQDLKDLVDTGTLKAEEAEVIARARANKAREPELNQRRQREEAARKDQQTRATADTANKTARKSGMDEVIRVASGYHKRFGAEYDSIIKLVEPKLEALMAETTPKGWAKLAETVFESVIAKRKAPIKKPSNTPQPSGKSQKITEKVSSFDDDVQALASGKSLD